jgi:6-phosphogluconolactonase
MSAQRIVAKDGLSAAEACAARILELVEGALVDLERVTIAVSGGSTPKLMFQMMASMAFPWDRIHLFFVDERCVPPTDPASNYKLANDYLLQAAKVPANHVHRVEGELEPAAAAAKYVDEIRQFFGLLEGEIPAFDIVHRGIGPDAHTASLFPGNSLIDDHTGIAAATFAPQFNQWRVTLLPSVLEAARHTVFLAAGADKVEALRAVFQEPYDPKKYPAQIGNDGEDVAWFVDEQAVAGLR